MTGAGTATRRWLGVGLALVASIALAVTGASAQGTFDKIKQKGEIVIGTSGVYPPFEFVENGELVGFDIDLGRMIAEKLGVKARFEKIEWKGIIAALKSGRSDILITAMTRTPDREAQIAFSQPYYKSGMAIITRKDNTTIKGKDDLKGKVLGAEQGSRGEVEAKSAQAKEVKIYETVMLAFKDLEHGRVEAVTEMLPASLYMISRQFKELKVVTSYNKGDVGINARLEDKDLIAAINGALEKVRAEGKLRDLNKKWFGDLHTPDI